MEFGTHHVCLKVSDPARSAEFYQKALGFGECSVIHHTPTITSYFLSAPDHGLQLQLLLPGDQPLININGAVPVQKNAFLLFPQAFALNDSPFQILLRLMDPLHGSHIFYILR